MATSPAIPSTALVTDILFIAHGGARQCGIAMEFLDGAGNALASGLTDCDALDAIGREAMAIAAAARACDPAVVPIGRRPRARGTLLGKARALPRTGGIYSDFSPQQQAAIDRSMQAEATAFLYMLVSIAALMLSIALFSWAIWA